MGCGARSRSSARDARYRGARPVPNRMERGCNAGRDRPWLAIGCPPEGGESIVSRASITKSHQKIQELAWEPTFVSPVEKFATDYTFEKAQKKDPLKQVLRSYFPMEEEKDHRVYGAEDGAIRGNMFRQVQERWLEWQKLFLSIIPLPEISAARAMPLLFRTVPNPELHNGQAIQMIDEVRHSTIQQNLKRLYMNNYIDPAGFNSSLRDFQNDYCGTIGRQF